MFGGSDTTDREPLWIVGVGDVDRETLETVADGATQTIPVDARIHSGRVSLSDFDETVDDLYHGLDLARHARRESGRDAVLAVTDADIGKPRGEPAFGLAMRRGSVGIVSTARLGESSFVDRLRTVSSQHVGYLVGMGACSDGYLFEVADDPADFDRIGPDPCEECRAELEGRDSPLLPDDCRVRLRHPARSGDSPELSVVAVGDVDEAVVSEVAAAVDEHLAFDATTAPGSVPLSAVRSDADDESREQYRASAVARGAREFVGTAPVLAVTDVDLFERRRNYVFGVGEFGGEFAAFSTARLADGETEAALSEARVRKQAVKQAGRLLGADQCDDRSCVFTDVPTVRELDLTDESPCADCRAALDGADWPPDVEGAVAGSGSAGSGSTAGDDGKATERGDEPPGEQSKADYLWQSLLHDAANTGRFVAFLAGFAVSFFVAVLVLVPVVEFFLGPWDSQSDQVAWAVIAASLVLAWYLYKTGKRLVVFLGRSAVGRVRSAAGE
ncbi:hypothetical protein [Halosimplex sp. TS25]|uniref:hypothetical protein n=1 Tax=Halosimplex rarum TaxID=3396619 RepID=UPI0039EBC7B4